MSIRLVRSMIVPVLLIAALAPAARGQDTTATAPPPTPPPQRQDSTATRPEAGSPLAPTTPAVAPVAAPATPPAALLDSVPEGRALLYLFNGSGRSLVGGAITLKCDGKKVAQLPRTSYSVVAVDPGKHDLRTGSGGGKIELTAEPGQRYFVLAALWPEKSWATTTEDQSLFFAQIEEARARVLIPRAKRNEVPK